MSFTRFKLLYFLISLVVIIPGVFSLVRWGVKPSIDFTGGSVLEINIKYQISKIKDILRQALRPRAQGRVAQDPERSRGTNQISKIKEIVEKEEVGLLSVQSSGENAFLLKMKEINKEQKEKILGKIKEEFGEIEEIRFETVGPTLGKELLVKTLLAIVLAAGFILLFIAVSFRDKKYGVCAILGMFHDSFILLGTFSLLGHFKNVEVDTLFVTAVLTILSFSVHDTVVVFNKIRESVRQYPEAPFDQLIDKAITETLARSVNNSLTIIFMLLALYLLGGETIKWFVFALLVGTIAGTYSSTFVAAPLLLVWEEIFRKKK